MKRLFLSTIIVLIVLLPSFVSATVKVVDLGIFNDGTNQLEIRVKTSEDITNGTWSAGVFTVKFATSYHVVLSVLSSSYGYTVQAKRLDHNGFDYYAIAFTANNPYTITWTAGVEYPIAKLKLQNGSGSGDFELVTGAANLPPNFNGSYYMEIDGVPRNRNFYENIALGVTLPVDIRTFTAKAQPDHTALLEWISDSEVNFSYYGIEHSTNGIQYKSIGKVESVGKNGHYNFTHANPKDGDNYYRLRLVDLNGAFQYSLVRTVKFIGKEAAFLLSPNPTSGPLELISRFTEKYGSSLRYQITDENGKMLLENQLLDETTKLDLSNYPGGYYYLTIMNDLGMIEQYRVVVTPK